MLNLGSAVIIPEVFLKALTIARNLERGRPTHFTTCDFDMLRHYRPRVNVVQRPTLEGGAGYEITGHHEIMVPLLAWAVIEGLGQGQGPRAKGMKGAQLRCCAHSMRRQRSCAPFRALGPWPLAPLPALQLRYPVLA